MNNLPANQLQFAEEIVALEAMTTDVRQLTHLQNIVSAAFNWLQEGSDIGMCLSAYLYDVCEIANGKEETEWKEEYKKRLFDEMNDVRQLPTQTTDEQPPESK